MQKTKNKSTPLHFATFYASSAAVIECLCRKYPLALEEVNEYGVTPRTYDLQKLSPKAKELLTTIPTNVWLEQFVRYRVESHTVLQLSLTQQTAMTLQLHNHLSATSRELVQTKLSHSKLTEQKEVLEHQLEDNNIKTHLLESLSHSIEKSLEESVRWGSRSASVGMGLSTMGGGGTVPASHPPTSRTSCDDTHHAPAASSGTATPGGEEDENVESDSFDMIGMDGEDQATATTSNCHTLFSSSLTPAAVKAAADSNNTSLEVNKNLERRIAYLEDRLANALESLDTKILKRDTVVENGWVMTNTDPI
jgi:hypothetical protein